MLVLSIDHAYEVIVETKRSSLSQNTRATDDTTTLRIDYINNHKRMKTKLNLISGRKEAKTLKLKKKTRST